MKIGGKEIASYDAIKAGDQANVAEEMGDLLFVMANLARHLEIDKRVAIKILGPGCKNCVNLEKEARDLQTRNVDHEAKVRAWFGID